MGFGSLLGAIGLAAAKAEIRAAMQRAGRRIAVAAITGFLLFAAICFGMAAFAVWLSGEIGTIGALLGIAGGLVVMALIIAGVARLAGGRRPYRRPPPPPRPSPMAEPPPAGETLPPGSEIGAMAIVALLGFLVARQMLRR